jgi:hypothetical protein
MNDKFKKEEINTNLKKGFHEMQFIKKWLPNNQIFKGFFK